MNNFILFNVPSDKMWRALLIVIVITLKKVATKQKSKPRKEKSENQLIQLTICMRVHLLLTVHIPATRAECPLPMRCRRRSIIRYNPWSQLINGWFVTAARIVCTNTPKNVVRCCCLRYYYCCLLSVGDEDYGLKYRVRRHQDSRPVTQQVLSALSRPVTKRLSR